ncbi:MAG TPA: YcaO-like family protein, partial [Methanomicrobiales archaeon]|nr:YcaO-like family protein [Methanomicrobiales archaeon]
MHFSLQRVEKRFCHGTHRARAPQDTLTEIEPLMTEIRIEDQMDLTASDRLGIPVFAAIRPKSPPFSTKFYSGKGLDPDQARVSTLMEAIERYSG